MQNPPFNNARGSASSLQFKPPFSFKDMTVSVFPLRANLSRLQSFYDQYLNHELDTVRFQPFLPYVYLQILDYGKMSIEAANMGWVSQCEVAFCVPLRWMVKDQQGWKFHDWAINCPFIFVDNELSMTTGREVYGWPKVLAHIDPSISEWVSNPHGMKQVFDIQTAVAGQAYKDEPAKYGRFLSVQHHSEPNFFDLPPNLSGMLDPLTQLPNMALNLSKMALDVSRTFSGIGMEGLTGSSEFPNLFKPEFMSQLLNPDLAKSWSNPSAWSSGMRDLMWSIYPRMYMNTVNLKQFRDASIPGTACYQALTNSRMEYKSINGSGPLGQQNLAFGQIDGGYRIDIHRDGNQPVVESLGLEIDDSSDNTDESYVSLQPVFPFWLKVDMDYSRGRTITWRTQSGQWQHGGDLAQMLGSEKSSESKDASQSKSVNTAGNLYNTSRGAAIQELSGPYALPNSTVRVLPLLADEKKLSVFARDYLDVEGHARYEAWGSHVYLIAYNFTKRLSENAKDSLFANREVNFAVPVKQYQWYDDSEYDLQTAEGRAQRDREKLVSTALVAPFSFVDDASVAITSSEVHGAPTLRSEVGSPPHTWMNTSGPEAGQHLLITSALVLPELGVGAGASHEVLLSVNTEDILPYTDESGWRRLIASWGPKLVADLRRKYSERGVRHEQWSESSSFRHVRALALEVLTGRLPINSVSLKQFRDTWEPDQACYQAIVQGRKTIDHLHEIHEIDESLNVWINQYPTQPVADILGLIPKYEYPDKNLQVFEAIRPFWLRADITEHLGQTLYERVAARDWNRQEQPDQLTGWTAAATVDINELQNDATTCARYLQVSKNEWAAHTESMAELNSDARAKRLQALIALEADGQLRDLQFAARNLHRAIMAHSGTLNHIDRVHVADLGALLDARQTEKEISQIKISELAEDIGQVSPATIVESILSRQWGRPAPHRQNNAAADFVVNVDSLGPLFDDKLFLQNERRNQYWPQSADDQKDTESRRQGLSWQLWDNVWSLIDSADQTPAYSYNRAQDDPKTYREKALQCLPDWFSPDTKQKPSAWNSKQWSQVSDGLKTLVDWSHYKVDWNTIIRELARWQSIASQMQQQLSVKNKPNAAGVSVHGLPQSVPPNVADVLAERLQKLAES